MSYLLFEVIYETMTLSNKIKFIKILDQIQIYIKKKVNMHIDINGFLLKNFTKQTQCMQTKASG